MGSLKSPCTTSYRSSIDTIAPNYLVFDKIAFFVFWRLTDRQTDRQTDEQMDNIDALSRSRCREWRLNKWQWKMTFVVIVFSNDWRSSSSSNWRACSIPVCCSSTCVQPKSVRWRVCSTVSDEHGSADATSSQTTVASAWRKYVSCETGLSSKKSVVYIGCSKKLSLAKNCNFSEMA